MKALKLAILTKHPYPIGHAATNRLRSYLEGLATFGNTVEVMIFASTGNWKDKQGNAPKGILNKVGWQSYALWFNPPGSRMLRGASMIWGQLAILCALLLRKRENKPDVLIIASSQCGMIPLYFIYCKLAGVFFAMENSEYPKFLVRGGKSSLLSRIYYTQCIFKLFDLYILMTKSLVRYHHKHSGKHTQFFHMPMTVDLERFVGHAQVPENYITYVGTNSYDKDGVGLLLEAYSMLVAGYPSWKLRIIGNTGRDEHIQAYLREKQMQDSVELMGNVTRDEVPALLCRSKILALARPSSLQAEGGFPTKLGEYLATGNLVVITATGEITDYLEDMVSALIVEPDSSVAFSNKLRYAMDNYDELAAVRVRGREVAEKTFNAQVQSQRLNQMLHSIAGQKSVG